MKSGFELQKSVLPAQGTELFEEILSAGRSKYKSLISTLAMNDPSLYEAELFESTIQAEDDQISTTDSSAFCPSNMFTSCHND